MTLEPDTTFLNARSAVARALLDYAANRGQNGLAQKDIVAKTGTDWYTVHMSLRSIRDAGAIRIDRNRIIVNRQALQRLAAGV